MAEPAPCIDRVQLIIPCKPEYVRSVRELAATIAEAVPLGPASIEDLKIAVSEAVSNVVRHAYRGDCGAMLIDVVVTRGPKEIVVEVSDQGVGFEPPDGPFAPDLSKEGGLGILLMKKLMDGVVYWSQPGKGTRIRMFKHANGKANAQAHSGPANLTGQDAPASAI